MGSGWALTAAGLVVALATGCSSGNDSTVSGKEWVPKVLTAIDFVVIPASAEIRERVAESDLVTRYATLPRGSELDLRGVLNDPAHDATCALEDDEGLAIDAVDGVTQEQIAGLVGDGAQVFSYPTREGHLEVFMEVGADATQVAHVRAAIDKLAGIDAVRHLSHEDAYEEFKRMFENQPALIETATPEKLPESFRVTLADPRDAARVERALEDEPGVDIIEPIRNQRFTLTNNIKYLLPGEFEIFMNADASPAEVRAVAAYLEADPNVLETQYLSHEDAYEEFERQFKDRPEFVAGATPEELPESFRVRMEPAKVARSAAEYEALPGVDVVLHAPNLPGAPCPD